MDRKKWTQTIIKIQKREILPSVFVQRSETFHDKNSFKHLGVGRGVWSWMT